MLAAWLGQTFEFHDIAIVLLLVLLEGTLSVDNALVLGLLARKLPKDQQEKALTYGLIGAFVFRFLAIGVAVFLLKWTIFKLIGGGYLLYVAVKHLFFHKNEDPQAAAEGVIQPKPNQFWSSVIAIELTDIAFAVDSIVAAIGVVGPAPEGTPDDAVHPKLWVVLLGGFVGVILMRFAALLFIKLLEKFPRFETAAYLLVALIGLKLIIDWGAHLAGMHWVNFHSPASPAFWAFWVLMGVCIVSGFLKPRSASQAG